MAKKKTDPIKTITKGFKATHGQATYEAKVAIYNIGFFVSLYSDGELISHTTRKTPKKAINLVKRAKSMLVKEGYTIIDKSEHHIRTDEAGFYRASL